MPLFLSMIDWNENNNVEAWGLPDWVVWEMEKKKKPQKSAFAGSRTRVSRLEGENANRYTTNALIVRGCKLCYKSTLTLKWRRVALVRIYFPKPPNFVPLMELPLFLPQVLRQFLLVFWDLVPPVDQMSWMVFSSCQLCLIWRTCLLLKLRSFSCWKYNDAFWRLWRVKFR